MNRSKRDEQRNRVNRRCHGTLCIFFIIHVHRTRNSQSAGVGGGWGGGVEGWRGGIRLNFKGSYSFGTIKIWPKALEILATEG